MSKKISLVAALGIVLALGGCAVEQLRKENANLSKKMDTDSTQFPLAEASSNRRAVEFVDGAYLGKRTIPLSRDKLLPPVFSNPYENPATLISNEGRVNLGTVSERITQYTGIPVEIDPNVYLSRKQEGGAVSSNSANSSATVPSPLPQRAASTNQATPTTSSTNVPSLANISSGAVSMLAYDDVNNISLNYYKGPLAKFLDLVTIRLGIFWEYEAGRIRFFRYKAQTFEIKAIAGKKTLKTNFSSNGELSSTGSGVSSENAFGVSQTQESTINFWESLGNTIRSMLSAGGKLVLNEASGTLTVIDTPYVLRTIGGFIENENRRVARSVHLKVEMYTLAATKGGQLGADLNLALTKGKYNFTGTPITSAVESTGTGGLNTRIISGHAQNTALLLRALSEFATVTSQVAANAYTVNNQPVPFTIGSTQSYIDSVGTAAQGLSSTSVTVTQKQVTTGVFIELLPHILDNNRMILQYVVDLSSDPDFSVLDTGGSASLPKIQSPRVKRRATSQTVNIKAGETLVLTQLGRNDTTDQQSAGLTGASMRANQNKETTLILITPVLIDNDV